MLCHRLRIAACFAACLFFSTGCTAFRCGGPECGDGCAKKSPYAGIKYDRCCETCGNGGFGCGCGCGDQVACGDGCDGSCGGTCASCSGASGGAGCGKCGSGSCGCGKQSPCWLLNIFATCAGCGERYWNEWYNDPPSCAEPCDCYGNWIGPGHGGYYRAPYLNDPYLMGKNAGPPPLELADAEPADDAELEEAGAEAIDESDAQVDAAMTAGYDDAELADGLR